MYTVLPQLPAIISNAQPIGKQLNNYFKIKRLA